ncbi:MAG: ElyC/SanA/YdcF family protein [Flavipsychrobacter sp.]
MTKFKKILRFAVISVIALVVCVLVIDITVSTTVKKQMYNDVKSIPHKKVGLLLGTSKYVKKGWVNLYYKYRIEAAVKLYKAGKIDCILVSGDNSTKQYDEPNTMKRDLIARGIPEGRIFLDYAGFRTLDSIMRCNVVFGEKDFTIISQPFHNERALFIANRKKIKAIAFNAKEVPRAYSYKVQLRERLARVKMMIDLMFNKQPKFYGSKIEVTIP